MFLSLSFSVMCVLLNCNYSIILHSSHKTEWKLASRMWLLPIHPLALPNAPKRAHDKLPISRPNRKCAFPSFQCHFHFLCNGNVLFWHTQRNSPFSRYMGFVTFFCINAITIFFASFSLTLFPVCPLIYCSGNYLITNGRIFVHLHCTFTSLLNEEP